MSFLTEQQQQEVANLFQNSATENDNSNVENNAGREETSQASNIASASPTEATNDEGHAVPYSRFKSVIEARNEYKNKVSNLERQLADLQNQLQSAPRAEVSSRSEQSILDQFYSDHEREVSNDPYQDKLQTIEQKLYQFEVDKAQMQLTKEIAVAQQKYPHVSSELLLNAVINDPDADVMSVAEQYNTFVSSVREQAIAEYLQTNGVKGVTPSAPPRINPAGGSLVGKSVVSGPTPKTMDQARDALYEFLKHNM
jgi:hypothetical protein